jgi:hypothetical protein
MLVIVGLVIAGIGLIGRGARPESPDLGAAAGRYRDRGGKQPLLLSDRDVHRDQRCTEPRDLVDPYAHAMIRTGLDLMSQFQQLDAMNFEPFLRPHLRRLLAEAGELTLAHLDPKERLSDHFSCL